MDTITRICLNNRIFTLSFGIILLAIGFYILIKRPIDVLPKLDRPVVNIMTEVHGMVPEDVEKMITIPLEQTLNGATGVTRVRSSSGLGLSIVRHIVLEHGGTIEIVSEEGVGSTFTIRLPQVLPELTNVLPSKTGALI